ncbi:hypothetical protein MU582_18255 [Nocardioidaceae bacterium SCSIO 66511]|nr:hypothetical protein MU582_18255 [Nocardioidaceae bacterium SCSIO 66511]
MIAVVEVGVALRRPPREDAVVRCVVSSDIEDESAAQTDCELTAHALAYVRPNVVMPVRVETVDFLEI